MARLADALAAQLPRKGPACAVAAALATLGKADTADLSAALANPAVQHNALSRALRSLDVTVRPASISRHRRGECACPR